MPPIIRPISTSLRTSPTSISGAPGMGGMDGARIGPSIRQTSSAKDRRIRTGMLGSPKPGISIKIAPIRAKTKKAANTISGSSKFMASRSGR